MLCFPVTYKYRPAKREDLELLYEHYFEIRGNSEDNEISEDAKRECRKDLERIFKRLDSLDTDDERIMAINSYDPLLPEDTEYLFEDLFAKCTEAEYRVLNDPEYRNVELYLESSNGEREVLDPYRDRWGSYWEYRDKRPN